MVELPRIGSNDGTTRAEPAEPSADVSSGGNSTQTVTSEERERAKASIRKRAETILGKAADAVGQLELPKPRARGVSLAGLMFDHDRKEFENSLEADDLRKFRAREFLKLVGRVLHATPYGASAEEIRAELLNDPHIRTVLPEITIDDVECLRIEEWFRREDYFIERYGSERAAYAAYEALSNGSVDGDASKRLFDLVDFIAAAPRPTIPDAHLPLEDKVDGSPSLDLMVDMELSRRLKPDSREHWQFRYRHVDGVSQEACPTPLASPELLVLRRTIQEALPHWTFDQVAAAHNRHAQYYAPFTGGPKTFTGDEIRNLLTRHPDVLGAKTFYETRQRFQEEVRKTLTSAKPGENFYQVLTRVCDQLARCESPSAEVSPEDLLTYICGSEELTNELNAHFDLSNSELRRELYPRLARAVVEVFGTHLHNYSIAEIAQRMRLDDPQFSEGLLIDLIAECPKIFGDEPFYRAERNFRLAVEVANTMHTMWPGATLDDVAEFMKSLGPLGQVAPDFSKQDVEILQGYDFVPKWPNGAKPDVETERELMRRSDVLRELEYPLQLLRPEDAREVRDLLIRAFIEDPERTSLPEKVEERIARVYSRALRHELARLFKAERKGPYDPESPYGKYAAFLDAIGPTPDVQELVRTLDDSDQMGRYLDHAKLLARLLTKAADGTYPELLLDLAWSRDAGELGHAKLSARQVREIIAVLDRFRSGHKEVKDSVALHGFQSRETRRALAQFARIPEVLETTQTVVNEAREHCRAEKRKLPFENTRVVMVQHELGQAYAQVKAFRDLGMDPAKCIFVGKPYHPNAEVEEALVRAVGVQGRFFAQGDLLAMKRAIEQSVDETMASRQEGEKVLIVCDGPFARQYFEKNYLSKDPSLAKVVRFTEQTAFGHRGPELEDKSKRVVSYARHLQKVREAPYIGRAGVRAINAVLDRLRDTIENRPVLVDGLGPIGQATAEALLGVGAKVYGHDTKMSEEIRAWAKAHGVELVTDPVKGARGMKMVVGCAGATTIDKSQIDASEPNCYYVSLSSELVEIDIEHLTKRATDAEGRVRKALAATVNRQPTFFYWLDDGTIRILVAGGLPVNFNDINSVAPEVIDFTMAMSVAAAVEAVEGEDLGYFSLSRFSDVIENGYQKFLGQLDRAAGNGSERDAQA